MTSKLTLHWTWESNLRTIDDEFGFDGKYSPIAHKYNVYSLLVNNFSLLQGQESNFADKCSSFPTVDMVSTDFEMINCFAVRSQ